MLDLVKEETALRSATSKHFHFANDLFHRVVVTALASPTYKERLHDPLTAEHVYLHVDLQYYALKDVSKWCSEEAHTLSSETASNVLYFLLQMGLLPSTLTGSFFTTDTLDKDHAVQQSSGHRKSYQTAMLALLGRTDVPHKTVLPQMEKVIIPSFADPRLLRDYLGDVLSSDHPLRIIALEGMYQLIARHNL